MTGIFERVLSGAGKALDGVAETVKAKVEELSKADFSLADYVTRQREFSDTTFGPGRRTVGVVKHIQKELEEIQRDPDDWMEWIDVIILAIDGASRAGATGADIERLLEEKLAINKARDWPKPTSEDEPVEHIRD
jgi:hypothetical protein